MKTFLQGTKAFIQSFLSWQWTKALLSWLMISAGTMSELAFVVASLWICINASVHDFVLIFLSESTTKLITYFATTAYVGLPELILPLAIVTSISHLRTWQHLRYKLNTALLWLLIFVIPTIIFFGISVTTLAFSLGSVGFQLPMSLVIIRGVAGYWYAIASVLYLLLGKPMEADRLAARDALIEQLRLDNQNNLEALRTERDAIEQSLLSQIENLTKDIEKQNDVLAHYKTAHSKLVEDANKTEDSALEAYSAECRQWLKSGIKTASLEDIARYSGHSKRRIDGAITKGLLQTAPRNKDLILVSSLVNWLKSTAPTTGKSEETPLLHIVNS